MFRREPECANNTYGKNCTGHCNCYANNSENKDQTCDRFTGQCKCKPNWEGLTCADDVNECETDKTLCNNEGNTTCVNTDGWYTCDCIRGFTETSDGSCVEDIGQTTHKPVGDIMIHLTVTLGFNLPSGTNLNARSTFESLRRKCETSLLEFLRHFVDVLVQVIVNDIRNGSLIVNYTIVSDTKDTIIASQLTKAVLDLQKGSEFIFDRQNVSATSESFIDSEPCGVYQDIFGRCEEGYNCRVENDIPVCKIEEEESEVNWQIIIGVSAAGLFLLIATAILIVFVRRILKRPKNKLYSTPRPYPNHSIRRETDKPSDVSRIQLGQTVKEEDAGSRFPPWNSLFSRASVPTAFGGNHTFEHPYHIPRAKITTSRDDREYSAY